MPNDGSPACLNMHRRSPRRKNINHHRPNVYHPHTIIKHEIKALLELIGLPIYVSPSRELPKEKDRFPRPAAGALLHCSHAASRLMCQIVLVQRDRNCIEFGLFPPVSIHTCCSSTAQSSDYAGRPGQNKAGQYNILLLVSYTSLAHHAQRNEAIASSSLGSAAPAARKSPTAAFAFSKVIHSVSRASDADHLSRR